MAKVLTDLTKINNLLNRGVMEAIDREHLRQALLSGRQLRIKLGIDPTAPDLHLGHTVVLRKLRQFQDLGHQAVLIIGDFTAQIGDPTGRSVERKPLSSREITGNVKTYLAQAGKVLSKKNLEIVYNSKWFKKNPLETILALAASGSIQQMLHRADFKKRLDANVDVSVLETMYPLFQGYDSVMVKADVELGGTDQKFNLLAGRRAQRHYNTPEQDVLMVPLLEGTDGVDKMSKSKGNYIGITEAPSEMFGKVMAIKDELVEKYFVLCTDWPIDDIKKFNVGPKEKKMRLASEIVAMYHGVENAKRAQEAFVAQFSKKEVPTDITEVRISDHGINLVDLLMKADLATSRSEARRLIEQGGVKVDGAKKSDPAETIAVTDGMVIQVGPRRFVKVRQ